MKKHLQKINIAALILMLLMFLLAASPMGSRYIGGFNASSEDSFVNNAFDIIFYSGNQSGETIRMDGAGSMRMAVPTAIGTATPGMVLDCAGVSNCFELRDGGTPVFSVADGGGVTSANTLNSGSLNNVVISQPTAATTATPAALINSLAAGTNLLEVRDASTPVFTVGQGGAVNGFVLGSNTQNLEQNCGTQSITAAATVVHNLSTPVAAVCSLAADPTGNQFCSYTNSAGVVTVKVWQGLAGTPTANGDAVSVAWCVTGNP